MKIRTYNETDHFEFINGLVENEIQYSERFAFNNTFPSLDEGIYCEVTIEDVYSDLVNELLIRLNKNKTDDLPNQVNKINKPTRKYFKVGLIIYSIIITFLFLKYWNINSHYNSDRNFEIKWNLNNTIMSYHHRESGVIESILYDKNYNLNFEEIQTFQNGQGAVSISYDRNEDGYYEDIMFYSFDGKHVGSGEDTNSDGYIDSEMIILENDDTLRLIDSNNNGILEMLN